MPYTTKNANRFMMAVNSKWFTMEEVMTLVSHVNSCNFGLQTDRAKLASDLSAFMNNGEDGTAYFAEGTRFPEGLGERYYTMADPEFRHLLEDLHSAVSSPRTDSTPKDIAVGKAADPSLNMTKETKSQDETQAFRWRKKELLDKISSGDLLWDRPRFEKKFKMTWT